MTKKEFNTIKRAAFDAALEIPEVAEELKYGGVYIYQLWELPDKHAIITLNYKTQLNSVTLRKYGFDSERVSAELVCYLNPKTKCAERGKWGSNRIAND